MENKNCPLCDENVVSDIGVGCRMCGMPLENKDDIFCSDKCEETHGDINEEKPSNKNKGVENNYGK